MEKYISLILSSNISWSDIVDIAIVSFLVYKLLSFIRSSRAEQLAKGLLFILAITFISSEKVLKFYALNWICERILSAGLIALVVVFQPELRRALEYIGRGRLISNAFTFDMEEVSVQVETIVRAIEYFSERKEGALIVIEKETALQDVAETGTMMDCMISEEAIENIFYKGSPLHDGAMILRSDRIFAAGCMLPLTSNTNLSKDLGTRHRAGIGITEVSDAVCIIVSEETGIISMAVDGKLSRFLDLKTIEKYLLNMYISVLDENKTIWQRLTGAFRRKKDEA